MTPQQLNEQWLLDDMPFAYEPKSNEGAELLTKIASVKPRVLHDDFEGEL